jgi:micrococcal nuclease
MRLTLHHIAGAAIAAAVAMPLLVSSPTARAQPVDTAASVLKVVDGDTIDIRDDVRGRLRVRVLGIDTPEAKKPGYSVACWGPEATEFAKTTMLAQRVALVTDRRALGTRCR